jgi:hypothetical protein
MKNENEKLAKVLDKWRVSESLPTEFKASVWRRIERKDAAIWPKSIDAVIEAVRQRFKRPIPVVAFLIISTLVGVGFGGVHASLDSKRASVSMSENYLKMIDPSRHTRP